MIGLPVLYMFLQKVDVPVLYMPHKTSSAVIFVVYIVQCFPGYDITIIRRYMLCFFIIYVQNFYSNFHFCDLSPRIALNGRLFIYFVHIRVCC